MIIMSIAEWIANLLVLGIAGLIWVAVVFSAMMIVSIINRTIKEMKDD